MRNIYLIKEFVVENKSFKSLNVKVFLDKEAVLDYISSEFAKYEKKLSKHPKMKIDRDGFKLAIYNYCCDIDIMYDVEFMKIGSNVEIPKEIFIYKEVNVYKTGEIFFYASGYLTESEVKSQMMLDVEYKTISMLGNRYWVSAGDIENNYVELKNKEGNVSYLEYSVVRISE